MSLMTWGTEFELGIPEMDRQHKRWVELLNTFYDKMDNKDINSKLEKLLDEVLDYTHYHFKEEERYMTSIGYEALSQQQVMHKAFVEKMEEFRQRLREGKLVMSITITNELKAWLRQHILVEDKKYAVFAQAKSN